MSNEATKTSGESYQVLCEMWRHFATWLEKLFGGFLAVLAALGFAYSQVELPTWKFLICLSASFVATAFWILDQRTAQLVGALQRAGERSADDAVFKALQNARFVESNRLISYGQGVDLLVGAVLSGSMALAIRWWSRIPDGTIGYAAPAIASVLFVLSISMSQVFRNRRYKYEKALREPVLPNQPLQPTSGGMQ